MGGGDHEGQVGTERGGRGGARVGEHRAVNGDSRWSMTQMVLEVADPEAQYRHRPPKWSKQRSSVIAVADLSVGTPCHLLSGDPGSAMGRYTRAFTTPQAAMLACEVQLGDWEVCAVMLSSEAVSFTSVHDVSRTCPARFVRL